MTENYGYDLPDVNDLKTRLGVAIDDWRERNRVIRKLKDTVIGQNPIPVPVTKAYEIEVMHTYHLLAVLNEKSARFMEYPQIAVVPLSITNKARQQSTKIEKWLNTSIQEMERRNSYSTWSAVVRDAILFDIGVERIECSIPGFWPDMVYDREDDGIGKTNKLMRDSLMKGRKYEDIKKQYLMRRGVPFKSTHVDPECVLPKYDGNRLMEVFELEERSLFSVMNNPLFDHSGLSAYDASKNSARERCTIMHYSNNKWHGYYLLMPTSYQEQFPTRGRALGADLMSYGQPKLLYSYEHGINRPIYNIVNGRFNGYRGSQAWLEMALMEALCDLNEEADKLMSQAATYFRATAWPTPVTYLDPLQRDIDEGKPPSIVPQEGQPLTLWNTERIEILFDTKDNPMFESLHEKIYDRIQQLSGANVLFGGKAPGVDTGYHHQLQIAQAEHLDNKLEQNFAAGAVNRAQMMLEYLQYVDEEMYAVATSKDRIGRNKAEYVNLSPKDLEPWPVMTAKVRATDPIDVAANLRAFIEATAYREGHNSPAYDDITALEKFMGETEPENIINKRMIQTQKQELQNTGQITKLINEKLLLALAAQDAPLATGGQISNADPALVNAAANLSGNASNMGGIEPGMMSNIIDSSSTELSPTGLPQGEGGGLPYGQPQPEMIQGLQQSSRQGVI